MVPNKLVRIRRDTNLQRNIFKDRFKEVKENETLNKDLSLNNSVNPVSHTCKLKNKFLHKYEPIKLCLWDTYRKIFGER